MKLDVCGQWRCGKTGILCSVDRNIKWYSHLGEYYGGSSKKLIFTHSNCE
jgi:hypothetical protein